MENKVEKKEEPKEVVIFKKESKAFLEAAKVFVITDEKSLSDALIEIKSSKDRVKKIDDEMEPLRLTSYDAYQAVLKMKNDARNPYIEGKDLFEKKEKAYRKVEFEKSEVIRKANEKKIADEEKALKEELEKEALEAIDNGDEEKAEELIEEIEAVLIPPVPVYTTPTQTKNVSGKVETSTTQGFILFIENMNLVLKASIDRKLPKFEIKDKKIVLSLSDIKKHVKSMDYTDLEIKNIGLRKEIDFKTRIY